MFVKPMPLAVALVLTVNTVPWPEGPPAAATPYRILPDKINPAHGLAPPLLALETKAEKRYRLVKLVPLVLTANIAPRPELPPFTVVPYRVLPDKVSPAHGLSPSLPLKVCRVVKPVPLVLMANTVPNRVLPDKINPATGPTPSLLVKI